MKRIVVITAIIVVSLFLIFTFYSNSTAPYVPGISQPFFKPYSPAYLNKTVAGIKASIIIYNYDQITKSYLTGVPNTGTTFTTLFFINVISENSSLGPFSLGLRVTAISGYIENSSAHFRIPIIDSYFYQYHQNNMIVAVYNFTYPIPPSSFHNGEYAPGNYTGTFCITIALTPTLWVYSGQSSIYVATVSFPIVMISASCCG